MKHVGDGAIIIGTLRMVPKGLGRKVGRVGNRRTNQDHQHIVEIGQNTEKSIVEIGQNTEKSPEDLRRLVVTQTPVKDHQLTLG